ncbi:MAG TPA: RNA methyltransferase [Melioribacteraceae bacterium]|nr:RNA methyltransferase [Melioribacteraceae bacterium]
MREFKSKERLSKIKRVLKYRQKDLTVILENIHDPHNVSAIFRSCDSVGVKKINLLYHIEKFPRLSNKVSGSGSKWVEFERHNIVENCFKKLKAEGYYIIGSKISENAKSIYDIDFTKKTAILFGNEHRGISEEAEKLCDELVYIPMFGMAQSLNVSVAVSVTMYEVLRQRMVLGLYNEQSLSETEYENLIDKWCSY